MSHTLPPVGAKVKHSRLGYVGEVIAHTDDTYYPLRLRIIDGGPEAFYHIGYESNFTNNENLRVIEEPKHDPRSAAVAAVEAIRQEAYEQGYAAAMRYIQNTINGAKP